MSCSSLARGIGFRAVVAVAATLAVAAPAFASSQHLGDRVLKQGMSGHDVRVLQDFLTRAGFPTPIVGVFGTITKRNVRRFEGKYHLKADGVADAPLVRELRLVVASRSSKTTPATSTGDSRHLGDRVLKPGMSGHDVRVLQGYLTLAGFPTAVVGEFGPATEQSVIAFQQSHNLTPNGIVTIADAQALRAVVAAAALDGPVGTAHINPDGTATAPADAPPMVKAVIAAANQIIDKPYVYGGGHATWQDSGYDCSGAVSYALHGANLLVAPEDSTELESYGSPGPGQWITIYADPSHTWVVVAGLAFDTADYGGPNIPSGPGPRWRSDPTGNLADGGNYIVRHPSGQ